jgi:hypothetical protein
MSSNSNGRQSAGTPDHGLGSQQGQDGTITDAGTRSGQGVDVPRLVRLLGPLLDLEFVAWQRILKEKGYPQFALTREQMIDSLEALLDWAQKDVLEKSPQNTQLLSVEPRQRIEIIQKWIAQWRDGTHEPLVSGKTLAKISQENQ